MEILTETEGRAVEGADTVGAGDTPPPPPPNPPAPARSTASLDMDAGTVTVDGMLYSTTDLPDRARRWCELSGLARRVMSIDDIGKRAQAYGDLIAGKTPADRAAKPKEMDHWRKAYGLAMFDKRIKEAGIRPRDPTTEPIMAECLAEGGKLNRTGLMKAQRIPAVVSHWCKLSGNAPTL